MTKALTHQITLLFALASTSVFLQPAAAQERSTLDTRKGADSLDRFAGTWEGKCQDGATFIVIVLHVNGTQIEGTVSIGNMGGDRKGACVSVSDPPVPEHAQKINEASAQQNTLSFKGSTRPDGTSARFELKQTESDKAELKLLDTPVADHPWQLVRVQKP
jgi:hypothetical protein